MHNARDSKSRPQSLLAAARRQWTLIVRSLALWAAVTIVTRGEAGAASRGVPPYSVLGNAIYDSNGAVHLFYGVDRPSLEWTPTGVALSAPDYVLMANWGANVVRISLNQDFWLRNAAQYAPSYRRVVKQNIKWAEAAGLDIILDLHWSDGRDLSVRVSSQQLMADVNSVTFWKQVSRKFKGDGRVLFELYNEPHGIDFSVWKSGAGPYVGMQALYDTVRATGARNLVIIGGIDWARDLPADPLDRIDGFNIVYAAHPYGQYSTQEWQDSFGFMASDVPVIVTEYGTFNCSTAYYTQLLGFLDARKISWTAWAWYPGGCSFPSLVTDWQGTPSAPGAVVKNHLAGY